MKASAGSDGPKNSLVLTPLSIVRMIWKRRGLLLCIWIALTATIGAEIHNMRRSYRAEAVVLVDPQKIPENYVTSTVNTEVQDRLATISQQILSFNRLQQLIGEFSLYQEEKKTLNTEELVEQMRRDIKIKIERGWTGNRPGAFRVSYTGEDPSVAARVANRISVLFADENLHTREGQAVGAEEFITSQLAEAKKTLDQLESQVSQYKIRHSGELPQQQESLISTMAQLRSILDASRDNLNRTQDVKAALENNLNLTEITLRALEKSANEQAQTTPATPQRQRRQSELLQERYSTLLTRYSANHPDVQAVRRSIDAALAEERANPPAPDAAAVSAAKSEPAATSSGVQLEQARERVRMLKAQIAQTERDLAARKTEQEKILREIAAHQERLGRLPLREQEMSQLLRDYENSKTNYGKLLDKKLSAEMTTEMERHQKSEQFTILDPARPPTKPVGPNRVILYTGGWLFAFAFAAGTVLLLESRNSVFLGEWELPEGVVVLGRLPVVQINTPAKESKAASGFWRRGHVDDKTWDASTHPLP